MPIADRTHLFLSVRGVAQDGWIVDVAEDGLPPLLQHVHLPNPLTPSQSKTCRWYLERYTTKSPFSEDRAEQAEILLEQYPRQLLNTLAIREALLIRHGPHRVSDRAEPRLVYISIYHDTKKHPGSSIHQLFWETLEDPSLWTLDMMIVVHRNLPAVTNEPSSTVRPITPTVGRDGFATINILLVVARDLKRNLSGDLDVSPTLAMLSILKAREQLEADGSPIRINLEVVRPGTLNALTAHLDRVRRCKGPGYFHIVHFDVHGSVQRGRGIRKGGLRTRTMKETIPVLHLAAPFSENTTPVRTSSICQVLKEHNVPIVLIMACNSATSSDSDDANMAQQFLNAGAKNVIGMSFRISSSAVAAFTSEFYRAFLQRRCSLVEAAAAGRERLRREQHRPTTCDSDTVLLDSLVAVAYGPVDSGIMHDSSASIFALAKKKQTGPNRESQYGKATQSMREIPDCLGRDFDLLRMELLLSQNPVLYLSGLVGIGKTTFLAYATFIWKRTKSAEVFLDIDLALLSPSNSVDVVVQIVQQLLRQVPRLKQTCPLGGRLSLQPGSAECSQVHDWLVGALSEITSVIIVREVTRIPVNPHMMNLIESQTGGLVSLLKAITQHAKSWEQRCWLIYVDRKPSPQDVEACINHQFGPNCYQLSGLELVDAIELSRNILKSCGFDLQKWRLEDTAWLEPIATLLQGNALALHAVLPLQQKLAIPWRLFYTYLRVGFFESADDLRQQCPALKEPLEDISHIRERIDSLSDLRELINPLADLVCLPGLFWQESVCLSRLLPIFNRILTPAAKEAFYADGLNMAQYALIMMEDFLLSHGRGYVSRGTTEHTLAVSPLFTIIAKAFLVKHVKPSRQRLFLTASGPPIGISIVAICTEPIRPQFDHFHVENYLMVTEYCIRDLPIDGWPLEFITSLLRSDVLVDKPQVVRSLIFSAVCDLLDAMLSRMNQVGEKLRCTLFFCQALSRILQIPNCLEEREAERTMRLSRESEAVLSDLPLETSEELIMTCRGLLLFAHTASLLSLSRISDFQKSTATLKSLTQPFANRFPESIVDGSLSRFPDVATFWNQMKSASQSASEVKLAEEGLNTAEDILTSMRIWLLHTQAWLAYMATKYESMAVDTDNIYGGSLTIHWANRFESILQGILADHEPGDLRKDFWHQLFMTSFVDQDDKLRELTSQPPATAEELKNLETMYEYSFWSQLCNAHLSIAQRLFSKKQFGGGMKHLTAIEKILEGLTTPKPLLPTVRSCRFRAAQAYMENMYLRGLYPTSFAGRSRESMSNVQDQAQLDSRTNMRQVSSPDSSLKDDDGEQLLKDWWNWLHDMLVQDSSWVSYVLGHPERYVEEVNLMRRFFDLSLEDDLDGLLHELDALEDLCKRTIFSEIPEAYPLQVIRNTLEVLIHQQPVIENVLALAQHTPREARSILCALQKSLQAFRPWMELTKIDTVHLLLDKCQLLYFKTKLAQRTPELNLSDLYEDFFWELSAGTFQKLDERTVSGVEATLLVLLAEEAVASRLWHEATVHVERFQRKISLRIQAEPAYQFAISEAIGQIRLGQEHESRAKAGG